MHRIELYGPREIPRPAGKSAGLLDDAFTIFGMTAWSKFREIKAALDAEDIEGLLAMGCPTDEYDGEASLIESQIGRTTNFGKNPITPEVCEKIIEEVWNSQFGPFDNKELGARAQAFASVARKLTER